jgi:hypothetical protein
MGFRKADESRVSVQTKLDSFFKAALLRLNQVQLLSLLSMNKCIVFLWFLSKGSAMTFLYIYLHQHYLHNYICHLFVF